jgi:hypothetical protein
MTQDTRIGECDLVENGAAVGPDVRGFARGDCGRDRQQPRALAAEEDHGRALAGQPKRGSWFVLAKLYTAEQIISIVTVAAADRPAAAAVVSEVFRHPAASSSR